jgi:hypothetical protein
MIHGMADFPGEHRSRNNCRSYARQSVEFRRLAKAAMAKSDYYFSNDAKSFAAKWLHSFYPK